MRGHGPWRPRSSEAVVHFFAADGCGYGKHRVPALLRVKPTDAELERWIDVIS